MTTEINNEVIMIYDSFICSALAALLKLVSLGRGRLLLSRLFHALLEVLYPATNKRIVWVQNNGKITYLF